MCYDYNELYCRKDQCDRESVVAKNLVQSVVDAGQKLLSTTLIKKIININQCLTDPANQCLTDV